VFVCRSLICYEDFCRSLESNGASEFGAHGYGSARRNLEQSGVGQVRTVMGDGYDGMRRSEEAFGTRGQGGYDNRDRDRDRGDQRAPRGYDRMMDSRDTTPRDRDRGIQSHNRSSYDRDFATTHDRGSLLPPKPSDSVTRLRLGKTNSFNNSNMSSSYDSGR
jgi:hypothetical protein